MPTSPARAFDFFNAGTIVTDFLSGTPFPNNVIPSSRVDPLALKAIGLLPLPTSEAPGGVNATFTASGALPAGGHCAIGGGSLSQLANFGGFTQISRGAPGLSQTTTFQLLVDGLVVASKDITYAVD